MTAQTAEQPHDPGQETPPSIEEALNRHSLNELAKKDSAEDYANERRDQDALERGDPAALNQYRMQARVKRVMPIIEQLKKDTDDALQREPAAVEARIEEERYRARAELRIEQYEAANPGFLDYVKQTVAEHGDLTDEVVSSIISSPASPEIIRAICDVPESIAALNKLPPREIDRFCAYMEGALGRQTSTRPAQPEPPKAKTVSTAPKPYTTVTGQSGPPAPQSPKEMATDMRAYAHYWYARERNEGRHYG
jgi:hypothetical protein